MSAHQEESPFQLLRNPEFVALAAANFARGMAFATIILALALYVDIFKVSGLVAGLFGSTYALARLFLVVPIGRLIDLRNPKRYLLAGLFVFVVVLVGLIFADAVTHVILLRFLQGVSSTFIIIAGPTIIGDIAPNDRNGFWIGTYNQAKSLSSLCGDLVGGALLFRFGFTPTYCILIAVFTVAILVVVLFLRDDPGTRADPEELTGVETFRRLFELGPIRSLIVFRFMFSFAKTAVILFLPIYARTEIGMSALTIGGILAGGKVVKSVLQGYVGKVNDRIDRPSLFIFLGAVLFSVGTAMIPLTPWIGSTVDFPTFTNIPLGTTGTEFLWLFLSFLVIGTADSLRVPPSMTIFVNEGSIYDAAAGSLSLRSLCWQLGAIVGPVVVGTLFDLFSFFVGFEIVALFTVSTGLMFIVMYEEDSPCEDTRKERSYGSE